MISCCKTRSKDPQQKELQPANQLSKAMMIEKYITSSWLDDQDQESSVDESRIVSNRPMDLIRDQIFLKADWLRLLHTKTSKQVERKSVQINLEKGIPPELRPALWIWMTDANGLKMQHGNELYVKLKNTPSIQDSQIFKIVQICVKGNQLNYKEELFDVLRAYSNYDNQLIITKDINSLILVIFDVLDVCQYKDLKLSFAQDQNELTCDFREVTAFWIFVYIMFELKMRESLISGLTKSLCLNIERKFPAFSKHLDNLDLTLNESFEKPILFMILEQCPPIDYLRIMDVFLWQGQGLILQILINFVSASQEIMLLFKQKNDLKTYLNQSFIRFGLEAYNKQSKDALFKPS